MDNVNFQNIFLLEDKHNRIFQIKICVTLFK